MSDLKGRTQMLAKLKSCHQKFVTLLKVRDIPLLPAQVISMLYQKPSHDQPLLQYG